MSSSSSAGSYRGSTYWSSYGIDLQAGDYYNEDSCNHDIVSTKSASIDRLKRWRQAALVLNASRRFRYTLDLKKEEERKQLRAKIRVHAQVIRAAFLFQAAAPGVSVPRTPNELPATPPHGGDFAISQQELDLISREYDVSVLDQHGGVNGVAVKLITDLEKGIHGDETDILQRKNAFGSNAYPRKNGWSFWKILWDACQDTTLVILMVAAAVSLALGIKTHGIKEGWYDGGSIALAVITLIVTTTISDYNQSRRFESLNEEKQNIRLQVTRGGRRVAVSISNIVVGDVIHLLIGDRVPADGLFIRGYSLAIDESNVTGEREIICKDENAPLLMSGAKVADGCGTMLVTRVGIHTDWGLLMGSTSEDNGEETPLQVRLNGVATIIGRLGLVVALAMLIVLMARYFTGHTKNPDGSVQFKAGQTSVGDAIHGAIKIFTLAVTIVVVVASEGLPLFVTLMLSYSMKKMVADKALVRRLSACETMGSATTICSDKTGTLTLNQMTVVEAYVCGKKIDPPNNKPSVPAGVMSLLIEGIALNTTGSVFMPEGGRAAEVSGSPTEKAILQWGVNLGMDFDAIRSNASIIHAFPFNSEKKKDGVAVKLPNSRVQIHWKGGAEIVLASCTSYIDENGSVVSMDEHKVSLFNKAIDDMAAKGLRCIAFAYKSYEMEKVPTNEESVKLQLPEADLVLIAIVGLKDPCRPGMGDAVQLCINAGVKVRMVTGDNLQTAKAIALECGILQSDSDATEPYVIEGKQFRGLSVSEREKVAAKISVMARSSPIDKRLLVEALRRRGDVVAVTGDGAYDASALHKADIGLAMGIAGTEVAKESSDIIILDDNFASVVKVVRWGRSVYANIKKFTQFQLTANVAALVINVVAAVFSGDAPLTAVQLLWLNLIMNTLGALALATEPPTDHVMHRPPVGRREPLISNAMWRNLIVQALYQVTVMLILHFKGKSIFNLKDDTPGYATIVKNTLIFNAFVLCQVFNEFNARKPEEINVFKGLHKNRLFMGTVVVILLRQVNIIMFAGKLTSTVRLSWNLWLVSIAIGFISWPLAIIGKLIPVPETPFAEFFTQKWHHRQNQRGFQLV